jgi:hypothetical protein|nr:MAG TPA: hypothetical protein [Caudoviricetes sp.]
MNYREKIRKAIECPQFGDKYYGEWGALNLEQRTLIKRLLNELDNADNFNKTIYLENEQLKASINKAIDKLYTWGEVLDPIFQKEMLDILEEMLK